MVGAVDTQEQNVKFIGCPSYIRRMWEKGKRRGGFAVILSHHRIGDNRRYNSTPMQYDCRWLRRLFFAASGNGNGSSWNNRGANGNYWSASFNSARNARNLNFNSGGVNPQNNNNRYNGFAVRAVQHFSIL